MEADELTVAVALGALAVVVVDEPGMHRICFALIVAGCVLRLFWVGRHSAAAPAPPPRRIDVNERNALPVRRTQQVERRTRPSRLRANEYGELE